jgi:hypothetical protein
MKAKAARWSRFETKIAVSAAMIASEAWVQGVNGKTGDDDWRAR